MSRATFFLILVLVLLIGGGVLLSMRAHEVPTKQIEVDVKS